MRRLPPEVPQVLAQAERMNQRFHRAAAHARGHFARQETRRRAGEEKLHSFGIEKAAGELLPARYGLNLVQEESRPPAVPPLRVQAVVLLDNEIEVGNAHPGKSLVLE